MYMCTLPSLVPRLSLIAFFVFFVAVKKAVREGLGTRLHLTSSSMSVWNVFRNRCKERRQKEASEIPAPSKESMVGAIPV